MMLKLSVRPNDSGANDEIFMKPSMPRPVCGIKLLEQVEQVELAGGGGPLFVELLIDQEACDGGDVFEGRRIEHVGVDGREADGIEVHVLCRNGFRRA